MVRKSPSQLVHVGFAELRGLTAGQWAERLTGPAEGVARLLEAAAKYGLVEAQTALGQILLDGRGLPRDHAAAVGWFEIAAAAGYAPAVNMLGRCCELGWGLPSDLPRAAECYRRAAEAGLAWGQYNRANMLLRGRGTPRDRAMALALYRRAGAQGHAKSLNMVGRFIEEGWEMPADPQGAADLYRRAAAAGDFRGQYNLASVLARDGKIDQAAAWLDRVLETATTEFLVTMAGRLAGSGDARLRSIAAVAARRARDGAGQPCDSSMRALPNSVANGSQLN